MQTMVRTLGVAIALTTLPSCLNAQTYSGKKAKEVEEAVACAELALRAVGGLIVIENEANSLLLCARSSDCRAVRELYDLNKKKLDGLRCEPERSGGGEKR